MPDDESCGMTIKVSSMETGKSSHTPPWGSPEKQQANLANGDHGSSLR
jgi:hypothetical protein